MFLNQLNEIEKVNFIKLAYSVATKDGDYAKEEKEVLAQYALEMGIEFDESLFGNLEKDDVLIRLFTDSNSQVIKKIFIELVGLVLIDKEYKDEESAILRLYMDAYNLNEEYLNKVKNWVNKMNTIYLELVELI